MSQAEGSLWPNGRAASRYRKDADTSWKGNVGISGSMSTAGHIAMVIVLIVCLFAMSLLPLFADLRVAKEQRRSESAPTAGAPTAEVHDLRSPPASRAARSGVTSCSTVSITSQTTWAFGTQSYIFRGKKAGRSRSTGRNLRVTN